MTTLAEFMIIAGADKRPPMLEKSLYDSWKSRMEFYIENRDNRRMILDLVQNGSLVFLNVVQEDGLTPDVYAIVNHHKVAKEIWEKVKLLMQGTKLSLQEKECMLYDEFDKFSFFKGETLYQYYWRFAQLINNMNVINMSMRPVQVNTKFLNSLPPEWSKFVTDVKLARDLHTTNYDQLYSYLEQHEIHANETRLMRERYQDPLAFVANYHQLPSQLNNYHSQYNPTQFPQQTYMVPQVHSPQPYSSMYPPPHPSQPQISHSSVQPSQQYQSHQTLFIPQIAYNSPQPSTKPLIEFPQMDSGLAVPVFNQGDDQIACLNKAISFLTAVASSRFPSTNNQLRTFSNPRNQATVQYGRVTMQQIQGRQGQSYVGNSYKGNTTSSGGNNTGGQERVVKCYNCQGEGHMARQCTQPKRPRNDAWFKKKAMLAKNEDLDAYDFDCDDVSNAKAVLMANLSNYGSDVILEAAVQDTNFYAQQDSMILSAIKQMSKQMINHVNNWEKANQERNNESLTAKLERYKERVKTFEQRLNIDLSTREKMIDSQMDDMIKEKLALKQQIDSLEQNLSNQIKEKESLLQTFTVFKNESKEKESKYLDKEIDLEKKIKELDNIVYKVGQSAQTMHMLTKPQVFYDDTHKQALGYQNLFYLKKAQRIKPTLYDGSVISSQHVASPVIDDEETLILEEVSRSKMLAKQNDPMSKEKKVNTTPINYVELNRLSEDFGKRFVPQQELSDEQASHPKTDQFGSSPVKIKAPRELPKVRLVNTILKKA
ncbi:integrase, catalytic region, zinc finger, CCHC-type containing protein [Tanacetum coccineum]